MYCNCYKIVVVDLSHITYLIFELLETTYSWHLNLTHQVFIRTLSFCLFQVRVQVDSLLQTLN